MVDLDKMSSTSCIRPEVFLTNTIAMIKDTSKFTVDPKVLKKLEKLKDEALTVKKLTKENLHKSKQTLDTYKRKHNSAINKQMIKVLTVSAIKEFNDIIKHATIHGGSFWNPNLHYILYGSLLLSWAVDRRKTASSVKVIMGIFQKILTTMLYIMYFGTRKIVTIFKKRYSSEKNAKDFLYASANAKATNGSQFVNICLFTGLSGKYDVEYRLRKSVRNPSLIKDLIDQLPLKNDDFRNVQLLPSILLSGYARYLNKKSITDLYFESILCGCLGFEHPSCAQNTREAFIMKEKFEGIMAFNSYSVYPESNEYTLILDMIHNSLAEIHSNVFKHLPEKAGETLLFVQNFIVKCNRAMSAKNSQF